MGILVAGASLVPIVYSLNRGLWLGLAIVVVYAAVRYAIAGRVRPLIVTVAAGLVAVLAIALTPLGDLAEERAETGHSDSARMQLVEGALDAIADSPLIGHGGTVRIPERESRAPAGTHGQLWMIAVSHGVPAAVMFLAFIGSRSFTPGEGPKLAHVLVQRDAGGRVAALHHDPPSQLPI